MLVFVEEIFFRRLLLKSVSTVVIVGDEEG